MILIAKHIKDDIWRELDEDHIKQLTADLNTDLDTLKSLAPFLWDDHIHHFIPNASKIKTIFGK